VGELVDMLAKTVGRMEELLGLMRERGLDAGEPSTSVSTKRGNKRASGSGKKGRKG